MRIKPRIIITDVKWDREYHARIQSLFTAEGYDVINEKDSGDLKELLNKKMPLLIILGENLDFQEYLEFSDLKEFEKVLQSIPMICLNTSHPKIKSDSTLYLETPVTPEELVRIGLAHIKNRQSLK